jgi:hypothetical protein
MAKKGGPAPVFRVYAKLTTSSTTNAIEQMHSEYQHNEIPKGQRPNPNQGAWHSVQQFVRLQTNRTAMAYRSAPPDLAKKDPVADRRAEEFAALYYATADEVEFRKQNLHVLGKFADRVRAEHLGNLPGYTGRPRSGPEAADNEDHAEQPSNQKREAGSAKQPPKRGRRKQSKPTATQPGPVKPEANPQPQPGKKTSSPPPYLPIYLPTYPTYLPLPTSFPTYLPTYLLGPAQSNATQQRPEAQEPTPKRQRQEISPTPSRVSERKRKQKSIFSPGDRAEWAPESKSNPWAVQVDARERRQMMSSPTLAPFPQRPNGMTTSTWRIVKASPFSGQGGRFYSSPPK